MKYMLLHYTDPTRELTPDEVADDQKGITSWLEYVDNGIRLDGDRLRPAADTTTVRMPAGELLVADGPYAETKEQIAGYDVIECADLDEAIEVASRHPIARYGTVEIRPFWPM